MALELIVTDAGRAALVNATSTGTAPVLIAQAGLSATDFVASATTTALPDEILRVPTIAGQIVDEATIHVTITEDGSSAYAVRSIALYLGDGTLFAVASQPDPIVEKAAASAIMIAFDVIFADIDAALLSFGDTNFTVSPATTDRLGIVELATSAEAAAGVDAARVLTPATAKHAVGSWLSPAEILTLLKTVDGAGSGLDADTLDGLDSSAFTRLTGFVANRNGGYIAFANGFKIVWSWNALAYPANVNRITYPISFTSWSQPVITEARSDISNFESWPGRFVPTSITTTGFNAVHAPWIAPGNGYVYISYFAIGV